MANGWKFDILDDFGKHVFKMISKQLEFYKGNFETQFCHLTCFTRKLFYMILKIDFANWHILREKLFEAARPILGLFLDMYNLRGF